MLILTPETMPHRELWLHGPLLLTSHILEFQNLTMQAQSSFRRLQSRLCRLVKWRAASLCLSHYATYLTDHAHETASAEPGGRPGLKAQGPDTLRGHSGKSSQGLYMQPPSCHSSFLHKHSCDFWGALLEGHACVLSGREPEEVPPQELSHRLAHYTLVAPLLLGFHLHDAHAL